MSVLEDDHDLRVRIDQVLRQTRRALDATDKALALTNSADDRLRQKLAADLDAWQTPTSLEFEP